MVQRIQYTAQRQQFESELTAMFQDLQNYRMRDNANQDYIQKLERRIATLMAFFRSADGAILEAEEERQQAFLKGLEKGRKEQNGQQFHRLDPSAREMYRAQTISQAREAFPNLF